MVLTVFRNRVRPELKTEYLQWVARMKALAGTIPGFISHKAFFAEDGEAVALVEFESEEAQRAWRMHPEHVAAQKKGRQDFYLEYRIQVCQVQRESAFPKKQ